MASGRARAALARVVQIASVSVVARDAVRDVRVRRRADGGLARLARVHAVGRACRDARATDVQKPGFSVGGEHTPVHELQIPAVWHASGAAHVTWLPAMHAPDWHVSPTSQALPSLHDVPLVTFVNVDVLTEG